MALSTVMATLWVGAMLVSFGSLGLVTIRFHDSGVARQFWQRARGSLSVWSSRRRRGPLEVPRAAADERVDETGEAEVSLPRPPCIALMHARTKHATYLLLEA